MEAVPVPQDFDASMMARVRGNLQGLAGRAQAGAVAFRWTVWGILAVLVLAAGVKPGATIASVLSAASMLFFGLAGRQLAADIRSGVIPLPSNELLRQARIRLDLLSILYERKRHKKTKFFRYLLADASSMLGRNFLCIREDRVGYPRDEAENYTFFSTFDLNSGYETSVKPLSIMGEGWSSAVKKTFNMCACFQMETEDAEDFDEVRCEVCGVTTDQGAERDICDQSVRILPGYADKYLADDPRCYLWPNALFVAGHMHLMYNALSDACQNISVSKRFFEILSVMCAFLGDSGLRGKFQEFCCAGKPCRDLFDHFPRHHVDWRWEFLCPAVEGVNKLWDHVCDNFNLSVLLMSESGKLDRQVLENVDAAIKDRLLFPAVAELFWMLAEVTNRYSSRLEGCHCHGDIWHQKRSFSTRQRQMQAATGYKHCIWKTRQGAWWVAEGLAEMFAAIRDCRSEAFNRRMTRISPAQQAQLLQWLGELVAKLTEILTEKMAFWYHIPWRVIGVFWGELSGDPTNQKWRDILRGCIEEYDDAVNHQRSLCLHRVARLLLDPGTLCGKELRELLANPDRRLRDYKIAYAVLLRYALVALIERSVESIHARLKRIGDAMSYVHTPTLCARLREPDTLRNLQTDDAFHAFCLATYRKTSVYNDLLAQRVPFNTLQGMKNTEKLAAVYQCDLDSMYANMTVAHEQQKTWAATVESFKAPMPDIYRAPTPAIKATTRLLKCLLRDGVYYSMPKDLFDRLVGTRPEGVDMVADPTQMTLALASGETREFDHVAAASGATAQTIFRVVNSSPEARTLVDVPHVQLVRTRIAVAPLRFVSFTNVVEQWIVHEDTADQAGRRAVI